MAGIAALGTQSIKLYSDYEQLVGGVETLFGASGAGWRNTPPVWARPSPMPRREYNALIAAQDAVMANARDAWKNAGMSANEYMDTVTSFSAALIQGLGGDTQAAAKSGRT